MTSEILIRHPWLWPLAWQSTLCLAAGLIGSFLLRRHAVRAHQILLLGLIAVALIPVLSHVVKRNQWGLFVAERIVAPPQRHEVAGYDRFAIPDQPMVHEQRSVPPSVEIPAATPTPSVARFDVIT